MRFFYLMMIPALFASVLSVVDAKPKAGPLSKSEVRKLENNKKKEDDERKKLLQKSKKTATAIVKSMAAVTPILRPDVEVPESELPDLKEKAESGDVAALIRLGHYYMMHPQPGFANEKEAGRCFEKAAASGDGDALAWLAVYNYLVIPAPAAQWKKKIEALHDEAMKSAEKGSMLGEYLAALSIQDSSEEKLELYERAAKKGFVPAMRGLGETIVDYTYRNVRPLSNYCVTPEAQAWLKLAADQGDSLAWGLLSTEGAHFSGSEKDRPALDFAKLEGFAKKGIEQAKKIRWHWYDSLFDIRIPVERYAWGGAGSMNLLNAYGKVSELYHRQRKSQTPFINLIKNDLTKLAAEGNTDAMVAIVKAASAWKFFFPYADAPCPFNPAPYEKALREKAEAGNLHIARQLKS